MYLYSSAWIEISMKKIHDSFTLQYSYILKSIIFFTLGITNDIENIEAYRKSFNWTIITYGYLSVKQSFSF